MSGTGDDMKGRAKQAAGDLTDNKDLKAEGRADRTSGSIKNKVDDAKRWFDRKFGAGRDRRR
jgi:uncharacterized protein YjbJ (UPF0337 family)